MKKTIALAPEVAGATAHERLQSAAAIAAASARRGGHSAPALIAVSKTVPAHSIWPLLQAGHRTYGENRVQEAQAKWPELKGEWPDVELHLVGQLQSNKAQEAVQMFDAIHSVDRSSLVRALGQAVQRAGRQPRLFAQVNIAAEPQKGGCLPHALPALLEEASEAGLTITGLMTVPPADREPSPHFALLARMARNYGLQYLSMGMSSDFDIAAQLGATHVRVGTSVFGARTDQM